MMSSAAARILKPAGGVAALVAALVVAGSFSPPARSGDTPAPSGGGPARADFPSQAGERSVPGQLLVRFAGDTDAAERAALREEAETDLERPLPVRGLQLLSVERGQSAAEAIDELERSQDVLYAEPNLRRSASAIPNDPYFRNLWGLHSSGQTVAGRTGTADADIDAPEAWDSFTGSPEVKVAVVDSGIDDQHPDLRDQIWRNPGEVGAGKETNGVDDDSNGLIDDWRGWDWVQSDNSPRDLNGHGTHVSGTVAAEGDDGNGVVGVAWRSKVMPLRVLDADGSGSVADLVSAYRYAAAKGAKVVNASLGGSSASRAELDAIRAAPGTLFVVAAGNGGSDGIGDNNDSTPEFPCSYTADNVVCVAATDRNDSLAAFSNVGAQSVDLGAPGTDILSDQPGESFAFYDGTSMATPHVAGTAALIWTARPDASPAEVKLALLGGVDPKPGLTGKTVSGGRLNAFRSLALAAPGADGLPVAPAPAPTPAPPTTTSPATSAPGATTPTEPAPEAVERDVTPPVTFVKVRRRQRLRTVRRRGIRVKVRCSEGCAIRSAVQLREGTARRLGLSARPGRPTVIGRGRLRHLTRAGSTSFVLKLSRRAKRKLRRVRRPLKLTLQISTSDTAGNRRGVRRRITLRR
jgi:subtilisin family serine protease